MSDKSSIEWTDSTWNPITGCTKVSAGCKNCYAERFAERWRGTPGHPYEQGFDLRLWPERLTLPLNWKEPRMIFVNSMSDLFHKNVPDDFIMSVFDVMFAADHHTFQILTKRPERMASWTKKYMSERIPSHIWLGTSIENQNVVHRIADLQRVSARVRFLSVEPLIGPVHFSKSLLEGIHWVIVGGESGPGARTVDPEWVRDIQKACIQYNIPFFFKQWGAYNEGGIRVGKKKAGRQLDGKTWDQLPLVAA